LSGQPKLTWTKGVACTLFKPDEVKEIVDRAKREGWAFQKTFQVLKDAGVTRYRTRVSNQETMYVGTEAKYVASTGTQMQQKKKEQEVADSFDGRAVQEAIVRHQENKTSYEEFLVELASAGVEFYEVYTDTGAIHYTTGNPLESFVQPVTDVWD
jgi:uncharacterized protein YbcV (DUF1398 family)